MTTNDLLSRLSDAELLIEVKRLAAIERNATADLIRSLAEIEARGLHLASGCSSMFGYCTQVLHCRNTPPTRGSRRLARRRGFRSCWTC